MSVFIKHTTLDENGKEVSDDILVSGHADIKAKNDALDSRLLQAKGVGADVEWIDPYEAYKNMYKSMYKDGYTREIGDKDWNASDYGNCEVYVGYITSGACEIRISIPVSVPLKTLGLTKLKCSNKIATYVANGEDVDYYRFADLGIKHIGLRFTDAKNSGYISGYSFDSGNQAQGMAGVAFVNDEVIVLHIRQTESGDSTTDSRFLFNSTTAVSNNIPMTVEIAGSLTFLPEN